MTEEKEVQPNKDTNPEPSTPTAEVKPVAQTQDERAQAALDTFSKSTGAGQRSSGGSAGQGGGFGARKFGGARRNNDRRSMVRKKEEFQDQTLDMRRVARVMAGGKRFSFRATLVIGDGRGRVGVGVGKGLDVQQAIVKAKRDAQKNLIVVPMNKRTIPHEVEAKFSAARIRLKPAKEGNGLVAGGAVRAVLTLAGVRDITAKALGRTPNKLTNALAAIEALKKLKGKKRSMPKTEKAITS